MERKAVLGSTDQSIYGHNKTISLMNNVGVTKKFAEMFMFYMHIYINNYN